MHFDSVLGQLLGDSLPVIVCLHEFIGPTVWLWTEDAAPVFATARHLCPPSVFGIAGKHGRRPAAGREAAL